jgi:hypothetical protein
MKKSTLATRPFAADQMEALIEFVQEMPKHSPKTTAISADGLPLFIGMEPSQDGAWIHWVEVIKQLRHAYETAPQLTASEAFADWLNEGPKLAVAAGCHVGIQVTEGKTEGQS